MSNYAICLKCGKSLCNTSIPNYCMYCGFCFKDLKQKDESVFNKFVSITEDNKIKFYEFQKNKKCKLVEYENNFYRLIQNDSSYFFSCNSNNLVWTDNKLKIITNDKILIEIIK